MVLTTTNVIPVSPPDVVTVVCRSAMHTDVDGTTDKQTENSFHRRIMPFDCTFLVLHLTNVTLFTYIISASNIYLDTSN